MSQQGRHAQAPSAARSFGAIAGVSQARRDEGQTTAALFAQTILHAEFAVGTRGRGVLGRHRGRTYRHYRKRADPRQTRQSHAGWRPLVVPVVALKLVRRGVDGDANEPFLMWKIEIPLHVGRCVMGSQKGNPNRFGLLGFFRTLGVLSNKQASIALRYGRGVTMLTTPGLRRALD